jgi:hypothetical protein
MSALVLMKNRSILLALAASMAAATITATLLLPQNAGAYMQGIATDQRCEGYQRLAILLQSAAQSEQFSMEECERSLKSEMGPETF